MIQNYTSTVKCWVKLASFSMKLEWKMNADLRVFDIKSSADSSGEFRLKNFSQHLVDHWSDKEASSEEKDTFWFWDWREVRPNPWHHHLLDSIDSLRRLISPQQKPAAHRHTAKIMRNECMQCAGLQTVIVTFIEVLLYFTGTKDSSPKFLSIVTLDLLFDHEKTSCHPRIKKKKL